jgi:hypothetical protein
MEGRPWFGCGHVEEGVGVWCSAWRATGGGVGVRPLTNAQTWWPIGEAGDRWGVHGPLWRSWASLRERKGEQSRPKENNTIF